MNLAESSSNTKYLMVASNNCRKIHTVILRKYYVTMSLCKFVLRFLTNTYEGISFQNLFKTRSCHSTKYEVLDIYIWRNLTQVYSLHMALHIGMHMPKQTMQVSLNQNSYRWLKYNIEPFLFSTDETLK